MKKIEESWKKTIAETVLGKRKKEQGKLVPKRVSREAQEPKIDKQTKQ
jgi:hypothetical protein